MKWTVATVLKTGGDFRPEHVRRVKEMVEEHFKDDFDFVCLTDTYIRGVDRILLKHFWPGWWSKIELFRVQQELGAPLFYLDLDVLILQDFKIPVPGEREIILLRDFMLFGKPMKESSWWTTSFMAWNCDMSFVHQRVLDLGIERVSTFYRWDQIFLGKTLQEAGGFSIAAFDDYVTTKSFKVHGLAPFLPNKDVQIVGFHGQPRPWDCDTPWVKEKWHGGTSD